MQQRTITMLVMAAMVFIPSFELDARGRGGGGRGGGGRGGGRSFGGGGRSVSRPSRPSPSRRPTSRPSYNRPSSRPSTPSISRPSRPSSSRPSIGNRPTTRPSVGNRPSIGNRPGTGNRPSTGIRPGGNRPDLTPGQRPSVRPGTGNRPGIGDRPGGGNRPGIGDRPSQLPTLPGLGNGNRPGIGDRPGNRPGIGDRPGNRPGLGDRPGNRPGNRPGYRPGYRPPRPPAYGHYRGWHHGYWHANAWRPGYHARYWWNRYPVMTTIGLTTWAVNRIGWASGYYNYSNPYASTTVIDNSVYNYSEPIIVPAESETEEAEPAADESGDVSSAALSQFDTARQQFYAGKYSEALTSVDAAIKEMPNDAVLHEFRALCLFAMQKYQDSAATLYAVLSAGPGWDWTTMSGLYPDVATYTKHLRALESFEKSNPNDPAARLVLAYHYTTAGHDDAAKKQLEKLVELTPNDPLARQLLSDADPDAELPDAPDIAKPPEVTSDIDPAKLAGTWKASRDAGDRFELKLGTDDKFAWIYSKGSDRQELNGSYTLDEKGVLELDTGSTGIMAAQVVPQGDNKLDFYMLGDSQGAKPLKFSR